MLADVGEEAAMGLSFGTGLTEVEARWMRTREWARTPADALERRSKPGLHMIAAQRLVRAMTGRRFPDDPTFVVTIALTKCGIAQFAIARRCAAMHNDQAFQASSPKNFHGSDNSPALFFRPALRYRRSCRRAEHNEFRRGSRR